MFIFDVNILDLFQMPVCEITLQFFLSLYPSLWKHFELSFTLVKSTTAVNL